MDIKIQCGASVLADGDPYGVGVCEELVINGQHVFDTANFIFATNPAFFDRDIRGNTVSFRLFKLFASYHEQLHFALLIRQTIGAINNLLIILEEDGVRYTWTATGAAWGVIQTPASAGLSNLPTFTVQCGDFTPTTETLP